MKKIIKITPLPSGTNGTNVRTLMPADIWEFIRMETYRQAKGRCLYCDEYLTNFECHEVWEYNFGTGTQILKGFECLCSPCHMVHHAGFHLINERTEVVDHAMKINGWTEREFWKHLDIAIHERANLNRYITKVNVNYILKFLKEAKLREDKL